MVSWYFQIITFCFLFIFYRVPALLELRLYNIWKGNCSSLLMVSYFWKTLQVYKGIYIFPPGCCESAVSPQHSYATQKDATLTQSWCGCFKLCCPRKLLQTAFWTVTRTWRQNFVWDNMAFEILPHANVIMPLRVSSNVIMLNWLNMFDFYNWIFIKSCDGLAWTLFTAVVLQDIIR